MLAAVLGTATPAFAAAAAPAHIDYLYVAANEGSSTGGHVAVRFGTATFHFQHVEPGLIQLRRDTAAAFDYGYAMLANRPIHVSRIGVSRDTYDRLLDAFTQRTLIQAAQFERLATLRADAAMLEFFTAPADATADGIDLDRLGLFLADCPQSIAGTHAPACVIAPDDGTADPALMQLRAALARRYGDDFLARAIAAQRRRLQQFVIAPANGVVPRLDADRYPTVAVTAASRWRDETAYLFALETLQAAMPLRTVALMSDAAFALTPPDIQRLRDWSLHLRHELVDLIGERPPHWSDALLIGMARLSALTRSITLGRLVLLQSRRRPADTDHSEVPADVLPEIEADARDAFQRACRRFFGRTDYREADLTACEGAGRRLTSALAAADTGTTFLAPADSLFPELPARRADVISPLLPDPAGSLAGARAAVEAYERALQRAYPYRLLTRNCVTEIFRIIDDTVMQAAAGDHRGGARDTNVVEREARRRLGGAVRVAGTPNIIPWFSARAVEHQYTVESTRDLPSYRQMRLADLYREPSPWRTYLRESNTLTSTIYVPDAHDSAFLFFTDDAGLWRPVFGAANVAYALGDALLGVMTWPWDSGRRLSAAASGAMYSLPDLVFINLRKGSMAYVPQSAARHAHLQ